jgi:hypothetical protein
MAKKQIVILAVFDDVVNAEQAIRSISALGVDRDALAILAHSAAIPCGDPAPGPFAPRSGVVAASSAMAATLLGIAFFAVPLGGLLAAGPLAFFGGAAAMVPVRPDSPDALVDLGVPHSDAKIAVESVRRGGIALVVTLDEGAHVRSIAEAIARAGAVDLAARADAWEREGWTFEPNAPIWSRAQIDADRDARRAARERTRSLEL